MSLTIDKCLQAWTNSLSQMNAKADIVFFGDSLTYFGDFANVFPEKVVCNLGLRGDTIHGMIDRIKQIQIVDPYKVFLMAGMNDVAYFSHGDFKKQYELLLKSLFRVLPNIEIVVQSLLPINETYFSISCSNYQIRRCNDVVYELSDFFKLKFIDLFSLYEKEGELPRNVTLDGIHLKTEAYKQWYEALTQMS